ncbi:MAG: hypothetical protein HY671_13200 [Chloroflexi bacterium]|nr:hypothetical protein [Chloroflexota bacterium]
MKVSKLILVIVLLLGLSAGSLAYYRAPASAQAQAGRKAVFGAVLSKGADSATLATAEGPVNVRFTAATRMRAPGRETVRHADLLPDDRLAVVAQKKAFELVAEDVMVIPRQPLLQHIVGAVTAVQAGNVTIADNAGNVTTVVALDPAVKVGDVVTAVVERDSKTGRQVSRSLHHVGQVEDRLAAGIKELEARGRAAEGEGLRRHLDDTVAHHLSLMHDAAEMALGDDKGGLRKAFDDAHHAEAEKLSGFGLKPQVEVQGQITRIDNVAGTVTIQPRRGEPITVKITKEVEVHKDSVSRGKGSLSDLKPDDSVMAVRFDPDSKEATRIVARSPKLQTEDGVLSSVNSGRKSISLLTEDRRDPLALRIDDNSRITRDAAAVTLDKLGADDIVEKVEFRDGSLAVTTLSVLSRGQAKARSVGFSGAIESISPTQMVINGQKVAINAQTEFNGLPAVGAVAKAQGAIQADGSFLAREINLGPRLGHRSSLGENEDVTFNAVIEGMTDKQLVLAGKTIAIDAGTRFEGKPALGNMATVEFRLMPDGSLLATEVKVGEHRAFEQRDDILLMGNIVEMHGKIDAISGNMITIAGRSIAISPGAGVKAALAAGGAVKIEGNIQADGSILAREIKASDKLAEIQSRGNLFEMTAVIDSSSDASLTVAGLKVARNAQTQVTVALQAGSLVKVEGALQADGSILAREIRTPGAEQLRGREAEARGREAEGEVRGREVEARGREAEGEAPRGADSGGGSSGGGSGSSGSGSSGSGSGK